MLRETNINMWRIGLGLSTSQAESGLCPTWTQADIIGWGRFQPATDPNAVSDQASRIVSDFEFSDFVGFGQNLAESNEIWPIFLRIYGNMAEIWQRSKRIWPS